MPHDSPDIPADDPAGRADAGPTAWQRHFPECFTFDPTAEPPATGCSASQPPASSAEGDSTFLAVPAKWAVYLMADDADRPVQVLCVRNLRESLRRRLGGESSEVAPSKRVDYRGIVRRVYYRRVDSDFEADLVYLAAVRDAFPGRHEELVGFRESWFVHVDPDSTFPRYTRTKDLTIPGGVLLGPLEDRQSAQRLIEQVESAFDLCRYHPILLEAPKGKACAYKEMGRCPAPCDGSIGLDQYRRMVELSSRVLVDPGDTIRSHEARMRQAASELKFEIAGRIKQYIDELSVFGRAAFRFVRPIREFEFVVLQGGGDVPRKKDRERAVKLFLVTPGRISQVASVVDELQSPGPLLRTLLEHAEQHRDAPIDPAGAERIGLVSSHLFRTKNRSGVFLPMSQVDERSLTEAVRDVRRQQEKLPPTDDAEPAAEGLARQSE